MEITLLIKSIIGLVSLLVLLVLFLAFTSKKKETPKTPKVAVKTSQKDKTDFETLRSIIKNRTSSSKELKNALDLIIKYHGKVHKKMGERSHPDFDKYTDIIFTICRHPNTTKDIIINFDKQLAQLNPEYKKEINESLAKGLNSRGM